MGVFEQFPYTNFHDLNIDALLKITGEVKDRADAVDAAVAAAALSAKNASDSADAAAISESNAAISAAGFATAFVTPEMFGAVGDGVTDDSAAILQALATDKIVVLSKSYAAEILHAGDAYMLGTNNAQIIGDCRIEGKAVIKNITFIKNSATNFLFTAHHGELYAENCVFDADSNQIFSCVQMNAVPRAVVKDCVIKNNFGRNGIAVSSSNNVTVCNNVMTNIYGPGVQTFDVCKNIKIVDNIVYNTNIGVWGGDGGSDGCISTYGDTTGTGTISSENYEISGNIIYNDMIVEQNTGVAVRINGVKNCQFINNYIYNPYFVGLLLQDRVHTTDGVDYIVKNDNVTVANNTIITPTRNIACAMIRGGGLTKIVGNVFKNTSNETYQLNMIQFGQAGVATSINDQLIIEDNLIQSVAGAGRKQPLGFNNKPNSCIIKNNRFSTGGGMNGNAGRLWLIGNIIHTTDHNLVVNLTADYAVVTDNLYSYNTSNGTFTVNATNPVLTQNNNPDAEMYAV